MPDPSHITDDPYRPPPDSTPGALRPVPRVYGVLSMVFSALMLVMVVTTVITDMDMYRGTAVTPQPGLPAPQAGLMDAVVTGVTKPDPRSQAFLWINRVVYASTSLCLFVLGVGQVRRRRWAVRLTPIWSIVALGGLVLVSVAGVVLDGRSIAAALPRVALLGPYPVLLLFVFGKARAAADR
jgi:hypothetical protein